MKNRLLLILLLISCASLSNLGYGLIDNLERTTTISQSYESRSVFTNPAGLAFQSELNGPEFLASLGYGMGTNRRDEFAFGASLGYFGLGIEQLSVPDSFLRYSLAVGVPITKLIFLGGRYSLTRSDAATLDRISSFDFGVQIRPSPFFSLGLQANAVNRPTAGGVERPISYILGGTLRPLSLLELTVDAETPSDNFGKRFEYQAIVGLEIFRGLKLRAGYHSETKFQAGLVFNFGQAALFSAYQNNGDRPTALMGLQLSSQPYPSAVSPRTALKVSIDSSLGEEAIRGGLFTKDQPSLAELLDQLEQARFQPQLAVVMVHLDRFSLSYAASQEIHQALLRLKEAGKKVRVFLGYASLQNYLIASAGSEIVLERTGVLAINGLRSERYYLKGTLDKIGIEGEFLARGEYKSAPETFTRKDSSAPSREETKAIIKAGEEEIQRILFKARGIDPTKWALLMKKALWGPEEAKAAGLVDSIGNFNDEMEKLKKNHLVREKSIVKKDRLNLPARIAVVIGDGDILDQKVRALSLGGGSQMTPERMGRQFQQALDDSRTEAIVFRISSPGGEILASDRIAAHVERARKEKPVIASMGHVAASGGYYVAAPANHIFADSLTITGSIGVFLGKFNFGPLYKKIDLNKEILTQSPYPGLFSEDRPWSKEERQILLGRVDQFYDGFIGYVAEHRKMEKEQVDRVARGRVWLGSDALKRNLVDDQGGYREAVRYAAGKAGLAEGDYETWVIGESRGLFDLFGDTDGLIKSALPTEMNLLPLSLKRRLRWAGQDPSNPFLYWSPIETLE